MLTIRYCTPICMLFICVNAELWLVNNVQLGSLGLFRHISANPANEPRLLHWRIQGAPLAPPQGSRFFHFDIQIFQNVAASGVGTTPRGRRPPPPPREILDPPLSRYHHADLFIHVCDFNSSTNVLLYITCKIVYFRYWMKFLRKCQKFTIQEVLKWQGLWIK